MGDEGEEKAAFAAALRDVLDARGIEQKDLATDIARDLHLRTPPTQSAVSQWTSGASEPTRDKVFAMERVLRLRPGTLSRHLGYLPIEARATKTFEDVIASDPALNDAGRRILRSVYREVARK